MIDTENGIRSGSERNALTSAGRDHINQAGLETANVGVLHRAWGDQCPGPSGKAHEGGKILECLI